MISLLVDIFLSILPKLWFLTLESAAILKWRESLNGRKGQTKRIGTKGVEWLGIEPGTVEYDDLLQKLTLLS